MPEGPSILILRERLAPFAGRIVRDAGGRAAVDPTRMRGQTLRAVRSWGKHLLFAFDGFSLRMHLLLFGRCRIASADAPPAETLALWLEIAGRRIEFQASSARWIEGDLDDAYDWTADVLSTAWDPEAARRKLAAAPDRLAGDVLLDQEIFSGVGNIIRNEVLFRILLHPLSPVGALPSGVLSDLIAQARTYSFDFLAWKRENVLKRHWQVHERSRCPRCSRALARPAAIGRTRRRGFYCLACQQLYALPTLLAGNEGRTIGTEPS